MPLFKNPQTWISIFVIALSGCSSDQLDSALSGTDPINVPIALKLRNFGLETGTRAGRVHLLRLFDPTSGSINDLMSSAYNSASQLTQLKYIFTEISICNDVTTTSAFGFSDQAGCAGLYAGPNSNPSSPSGSATFKNIETVVAADQSFDLMSSSDLERLNANSGTASVGEYSWAVVNWLNVIGVKGSVTLPDQTVLRTQATTSVTDSDFEPISHVSDMTAPTEALTYVHSGNGGAVFKFQNPITVTEDKSYVLDIIFNPESVLKGCSLASNGGNISDGAYSLQMPMLPVSAVLRETTDTLMRESYVVQFNADYDTRIDLYYLKSDSEKSGSTPFIWTNLCHKETDLIGNSLFEL